MYPGDEDMARAASDLEGRLPGALAPLAQLAYNYRWVWARRGSDVFEQIDPTRWMACGRNPVRLLSEASPAALARSAADDDLLAGMRALTELVQAETTRPWPSDLTPSEPVAFLCSEFGIHSSLPIYSGGLGILAGDLLKEASDQSVAMVGVGIMYRSGYFHQRIDTSGYQHEYWTDTDPDRLPAARVMGSDGQPLQVPIPVFDVQLTASVWRVDVPLHAQHQTTTMITTVGFKEVQPFGPAEQWFTIAVIVCCVGTVLCTFSLSVKLVVKGTSASTKGGAGRIGGSPTWTSTSSCAGGIESAGPSPTTSRRSPTYRRGRTRRAALTQLRNEQQSASGT